MKRWRELGAPGVSYPEIQNDWVIRKSLRKTATLVASFIQYIVTSNDSYKVCGIAGQLSTS